EKISEYLNQASSELNKNNFVAARNYAKRIFGVEEDNKEAKSFLEKIDRLEKEHESENEWLNKKEEAQKWAEKMGEIKKLEQKKAKERVVQIADFLEKARNYLDKDNFYKARSFAQMALKVDNNSREALEMILKIDQSETAYEADIIRKKEEKEAREWLEAEFIRREKQEKEIAERAMKIADHIEQAREFVEERQFYKARTYANMALELEKNNPDIKKFLEWIDISEKEYEMEQIRIEREKAIKQRDGKIADLLDKAKVQLDADSFDRARDYVRSIFEIDPKSKGGETLLTSINKAELDHRLNEEQSRREKELKEKQDEDRRKAEKIADYLDKARQELDNKKFSKARLYAQRAFSVDDSNKQAVFFISEIEKQEENYKEQNEQLEREKYARHLAEQEAKKRARQEMLEWQKAEKIAEYLAQAAEYRAVNNFKKARSCVQKAFGIDSENKEALVFLAKVEQGEELYQSEQEFLRCKKEARRRAEEESSRRINEELEERKRSEKIAGYLTLAAEQLASQNFEEARRYAKQALAIDKTNEGANSFLVKVERLEESYLAVQEWINIEEEKSREAQKQVLEEAQETLEAIRRTGKIAGYFAQAAELIAENRFEQAKSYVYQVLKIEENNLDAKKFLSNIEQAEQSYKETVLQ
ncbi:MAG: hypothetical protein ABH869_04175, partial [Candidatus Omnitrophota bacterium]